MAEKSSISSEPADKSDKYEQVRLVHLRSEIESDFSFDDRLLVNKGQDDEMVIKGYRPDLCKTVLTWIGIVLTIGALRLIFHWKPNWFLKSTHIKCNLGNATHVLLLDQYDQSFVETVKSHILNTGANEKMTPNDDEYIDVFTITDKESRSYIKYFVNKKIKYIYSPADHNYKKLSGLELSKECAYFYDCQPLDEATVKQRRLLYGENKLEVHVFPIISIIIDLAMNPFYIFQLFSCILWYTDHYEYYASAILIISFGSIAFTTYTIRKTQRALKSTIHQFDSSTVHRADGIQVMMPTQLVPGDIIHIPRTGLIMDVDAVLLSGNCIVNESMLTGECIPVTKTPLPNPQNSRLIYDRKHHSKHTLYCGTKVVQTRYFGDMPVRALVIRTGFMTAKGDLVRSIMFPKPVDFKFYRETYKFLGVLAGIAGAGMIYTIVMFHVLHKDAQAKRISDGQEEEALDYGLLVRRALDLITIAVPPALPAALAVGLVIAQRRLRNVSKIYCIQPSFINMAGSINLVCFDKTGTLTEEGLDLHGVLSRETDNNTFSIKMADIKDALPHTHKVKQIMSTCHSLTYIEGELSGDPLDLKLFEATGFRLEEQGEEATRYDCLMPTVVKPINSKENEEVGILRQFTFSSSLQRMSVITRGLTDSHFNLFMKGSPEMVASLSRPETIPADFNEKLSEFTQHGYRVIALAYKPLQQKYAKLQRIERSDVENDMEFVGLVILENKLKPITKTVIYELQSANIKPVMVTGDNLLTAVSVAKEAGFVSPEDQIVLVDCIYDETGHSQVIYNVEQGGFGAGDAAGSKFDSTVVSVDPIRFAMTGNTWAELQKNHQEDLSLILLRGAVYARMSPEQKSQLVERLQELGYYVGMCGDGANDCGALKTAHAGISLSEAEASIASPFTSKIADIRCVPNLIREGRTALVTSFAQFKFIAGYSITQFVSVLILYYIGATLTDFEFLYIDLIVIISLGITSAYTRPYPTLYSQSPPVRLASCLPILSVMSTAVIVAAFQLASVFMLQPYKDSWYTLFEANPDEEYQSYENTCVFDISCFQYITLSVMYAKGFPFRKHMFTNWMFIVNLIIVTGLSLWFIIYPTQPVADFMELQPPDTFEFRGYLIALGVGNSIVLVLMEHFITGNTRINTYIDTNCCSKHSETEYMKLSRRYEELSDNWPSIKLNTKL